jgi:AcrR family transcriptional regulator
MRGLWKRATAEVNKRAAILERLADFILIEGLEAATLRAMARAADQSDRMLLYYFKDKEEIITEVLGLLAAQLQAQLAAQAVTAKLPKDHLRETLDAVVLSDRIWPFLRLWLDLAARAARGDPFHAPVGQALGMGFHQWIEGQLATADPDLRRKHATEIMIGLEGVIVLKGVGMQGLVQELFQRRSIT